MPDFLSPFARAGAFERLGDVAIGETDFGDLAVAPHGDVEARRKRVRDRHADAVQAARERVGAAGGLVELAARVQAREDDLDDRHAFFRMHAERNAAAVVFDGDRIVGVQRDDDLLAVAAERLVGRVVDDFLNDVQRILGARVHAGPLLDRLQALQHLDRCFAVCGVWLLPLSGFFVDMTERESGVRRSFRVEFAERRPVTGECVNTSGKPGRQRRSCLEK